MDEFRFAIAHELATTSAMRMGSILVGTAFAACFGLLVADFVYMGHASGILRPLMIVGMGVLGFVLAAAVLLGSVSSTQSARANRKALMLTQNIDSACGYIAKRYVTDWVSGEPLDVPGCKEIAKTKVSELRKLARRIGVEASPGRGPEAE